MTDESRTETSHKDGSANGAALARLERRARSGAIGHLPQWQDIAAVDVEPGVRTLVAACEADLTSLEAQLRAGDSATWESVMEPLEHIEHRLGSVIGSITHLTSVKYSDELQGAYDAVRPAVVELSNRMSQSRPLFDAMRALQTQAAGFDTAQKRILQESIRSMQRSGVDLEGDAKERYQAIQEKLAELSNEFQTNLVKEEKAARVKVLDEARLKGIPGAVVDIARQQAKDDGANGDAWHFVVNGVGYMAVIQHSQDRALREEFYRAFRSRGTSSEYDNRPVLQEILALRQEMAQLVGFANYAELSIDSKMAPSTQAVLSLLAELETAARPAAEREYAELRSFMAEQGADCSNDLQPWDIGFWSERQRESLYAYDAEALRDYFQLPRVLGGLFDLVANLYGVTIVESKDAAIPVWDKSVQFFEVQCDNETIAAFYVDPYARPGEKRGGAWMNTVVGRSRLLALDETAGIAAGCLVRHECSTTRRRTPGTDVA